jgi:catechol 2,3-dioxygenase-like lactoylglutathione lyase family enzyme
MTTPAGMLGIRHVALFIKDLESAIDFYTRIVGMQIEWHPDPDNVYLTNHGDVFALHRVDYKADPLQRLDHIGFALVDEAAVDSWYGHMVGHGVRITEAPKTHRDGSRGFYCLDSVGHLLEFIYHPPISLHVKNATGN